MATIGDVVPINLVWTSEMAIIGRTISIFSKIRGAITIDDVSNGVVEAPQVCKELEFAALVAVAEISCRLLICGMSVGRRNLGVDKKNTWSCYFRG